MSKLYSVTLLVSLLFPGLLFIIAIGIEAPSVWTEGDFSDGTARNVYVSPEGEVKLATMEKEFEDDFYDETDVNVIENLSHETQAGNIKVIKTERTYGGPNCEYGKKIRPTADGGYIIVDTTESEGSGYSDVWLIKTNENGDLQWSKTFGGTQYDYGKDVRQTADGGYVITGYTYSFGNGGHDVWLIRTDGNGNLLWDETYGGGGNEYGEGVSETKDGGFIIAGCDYHDGDDPWSELYVIKTDDQGNQEWSNTLGDWGDFSWGFSVVEANDGDYVAVGFTESYGNGRKDIWLLKFHAHGGLRWHRTFGGDGFERGYSLEQTADKGYIIAGYTSSYGNGGNDVWLVKTDKDGQESWNRKFGGEKDDEGYSVSVCDDGGYIISGSTWSFGAGNRDVWIIRTDNTGTKLWDNTYGGHSTDYSESVSTAADGGYMILGTSYSYGAGEYDIWLIRTDPAGTCQFTQGYFRSTNLLMSSAASFDKFEYSCTIPNGTQLLVSFSHNEVTWHDSNGILGEKDNLVDGEWGLNLSGLKWNTSAFYYRMEFHSPNPESPVLKSVRVTYREFHLSGDYESAFIDNEEYLIYWKWLTWSETRPPGTWLLFQLRSSPTLDGITAESYLGPDGSSSSFYTYSGMNIWEGHHYHRWLQYRAYLETEDSSTSPVLEDVLITYNILPEAEAATPEGIQSGHVRIDYLLYDGDSDVLDVMVQYRIGYTTYQEATPAAGGDGLAALNSSPGGVWHSFIWDSSRDIGKIDEDNIFIRITPVDEHSGTPSTTVRFTVDNKAPEFISISPTDYVNSRAVKIVLETDENAVLRWSEANQSYNLMANQFTEGEGAMRHTAMVNAREGINTIYVSTMDSFGNFQTFGTKLEFTVDTNPPENISIIINNGDEYTNSSQVSVSIMDTRSGTDEYEIRMSNDQDFPDVPWGPFTRDRLWNLTPGDGRKAVYVELKDRGGNVKMFQGTIILDTTPPLFLITGPDTEQDSLSVNISVTTNEGAYLRWSAVNSSYYSMSNLFKWGAGTIIHSTLVNASNGNNTPYISAVDLHGNSMESGMPLTFVVNAKNGGDGSGKGDDENQADGDGINWKCWIIVLIILNIILFIILVINRRRKKVRVKPVSQEFGRIRKEALLESLHTGGPAANAGRYSNDSGYSVSAVPSYTVGKTYLPPVQQKILPPAAHNPPEIPTAAAIARGYAQQPGPAAYPGTTAIVPIDKPAVIAPSAPAKQPAAPQSPPPMVMKKPQTGIPVELDEVWNFAKGPTVESKKVTPWEGVSTGKTQESRSDDRTERDRGGGGEAPVDLASLLSELRQDIPTRTASVEVQTAAEAKPSGKTTPGRYADKISNSIDFILDKYEEDEDEEEEEEEENKKPLASIPIRQIAITRRRNTKF